MAQTFLRSYKSLSKLIIMTALCKSRRLINQTFQKVDRWDDPLLSHKTPICIRTLGLHFFQIYFKVTHPPIPTLFS